MRTVRSRLAVLTLMLLVQQVVALVLAGALACCEQAAPAAAQMDCCKNGGEGHMCPLTNRRAPDSGCRIKSGCSTDGARALAGAGFMYAAPLVGRFSIVPPVIQRSALQPIVGEDTRTNAAPATPPPKA
jgi:hypothetical protein